MLGNSNKKDFWKSTSASKRVSTTALQISVYLPFVVFCNEINLTNYSLILWSKKYLIQIGNRAETVTFKFSTRQVESKLPTLNLLFVDLWYFL